MTPEDRAARERKQKIFVAVGGVFLLVLLAIQVPKLLGGSGGSTLPAQAASTTPAITPPPAAQPGGAAVAVSLPGGVGSHPSSTGKLTSFGFFRQKDPFIQQVATSGAAAAAASTSSPSGPATPPASKAAAKAPTASQKFTVGQKSAQAPALTILSVNGARQALQPGGTFPSADPVFVLVAEHPGSKSVEIGVVGGAYAGGSKTTKLVAGKPLTLVNTTTRARYRLVLVAVGSGTAAKPAPAK